MLVIMNTWAEWLLLCSAGPWSWKEDCYCSPDWGFCLCIISWAQLLRFPRDATWGLSWPPKPKTADLWRELAHVEQWWSVHLDGHSTLGCIAILGLSNIKLCISTYMYQSLCFYLIAQEVYHHWAFRLPSISWGSPYFILWSTGMWWDTNTSRMRPL